VEHNKRWEEYKNSQSSTDGTTQGLHLFERDLWVQANLSKVCLYGFGAKGLVMKHHARLLVFECSSSVNNYDAQEMVQIVK